MSSRRQSVGAIVAAAGRSLRMGGADKLFAVVAGSPLLAHALLAFEVCRPVERIVLVLSPDNLQRGQELVRDGGFDKVTAVCPGGERRQDSVRLGLEALAPCDWVVVHDGARPLVTAELVERGLEAARETGAAIAAVPAADTIKEVDASGLVRHTLNRADLWAVQTPQVFRYDLLCEAHRRAQGEATDDAALVEGMGHRVKVFAGSPANIKVTTVQDLALLEALFAQKGQG
jgi:2-C-methyl-D-erythritol 4-phosphate cytidylyltransferase